MVYRGQGLLYKEDTTAKVLYVPFIITGLHEHNILLQECFVVNLMLMSFVVVSYEFSVFSQLNFNFLNPLFVYVSKTKRFEIRNYMCLTLF